MFMKYDICTKLVKERGFKKGFHGAGIACARDRLVLSCLMMFRKQSSNIFRILFVLCGVPEN